MRSYKEVFELETNHNALFYDITDEIEKVTKRSGISEGHVTIFAMHTTVGLYVNEKEKFLFCDLMNHLSDCAPQIRGKYAHDNISERTDCPPDEPENAHSHIKAALYSSPSLQLIVSDGRVYLGTYQRIFFAEFDGPCPRKHKSKRKFVVHIIGG